DGLTGLASPVVRKTQTSDRLLVARSAALLIDQDFGLVGTLGRVSNDLEVKVQLKGGGLGVSLQPWAHKGEVFAIAGIGRDGARALSQRLEWALLRVEQEPDPTGVCVCRLFKRQEYEGGALPSDPRILGYRCLKLGTTRAPLRMRFLSADKSGRPQ